MPAEFPYPYKPESFTEEERGVLSRFFTNVDKPVFAVKNLPQEVIGAIFSRYSRTEKSVRRLFLDEFWTSAELGIQNFTAFSADEGEELEAAREKAQKFYRRVFSEFGDDSVIQMGSVHVAFEGVSQIAAKAIEDGRIVAAYMEKSTRYVDFGSKQNRHYLFMEVPEIMGSTFADEFIAWNNALFTAYITHLPAVIEYVKGKYPLGQSEVRNPQAEVAYGKALKAKAFDIIRVVLPATTVTNLGAHFSGQAAENAVNKLINSPYSEVRLIGVMALQELLKVAPNFLQNVDHHYGVVARAYRTETRERHTQVAQQQVAEISEVEKKSRVRLVDWDENADVKIAAQILYTGQRGHLSKKAIFEWARKIKGEDLQQNPNVWWSPRLAEIITSAVPDRSREGLNRRQKLPRAFEHAFAEVEFNADLGIYRDLQRNRMSSTERQTLSAEEVFIPPEFTEPGMERVLQDYLNLAEQTRELNRKLLATKDPKLVRAAEYVTILGNRLRFNIRANIRQWVFFSELRTIEGGHPTYRRAMQAATRQILQVMPFLKPLFAHVNWGRTSGLGRLGSEVRTQQKLKENHLI